MFSQAHQSALTNTSLKQTPLTHFSYEYVDTHRLAQRYRVACIFRARPRNRSSVVITAPLFESQNSMSGMAC